MGGRLCVGSYEREVEASLARVWENVLDWEHLPWLHPESFLAVKLQGCDRQGWRAEVVLPPADRAARLNLELRLDRERLRYVARTLQGPGAGSEIWTTLLPRGERSTGIHVEFWLTGVRAPDAETLGAGYCSLYARLWDQDEAMMRRRQAFLDGALGSCASRLDGLPLGPAQALRARAPTCIEAGGRRLRVVELDGRLIAYATVCPHLGGPLEASALDAGCITCPWHGYRFDLRHGRSADGRSLALEVFAVEVDPATGEARLGGAAA